MTANVTTLPKMKVEMRPVVEADPEVDGVRVQVAVQRRQQIEDFA